jgi:hypothetical protein
VGSGVALRRRVASVMSKAKSVQSVSKGDPRSQSVFVYVSNVHLPASD